MPDNFKREDLRVLKTRGALFSGLLTLLGQKKFSRITVYDICARSLVSRTAFYAHFRDKYDLLENWLRQVQNQFFTQLHKEPGIRAEELLWQVYRTHWAVIFNLLKDADSEQRSLLLKLLTSDALRLPDGALAENRELRDAFLAGGLLGAISFLMETGRDIPEERIKAAVTYLCKAARAAAGRDNRL